MRKVVVVLITMTMGGVPKMLAMSILVLTGMMGTVLITMTMGGAKDIGDVDVSKNENDGEILLTMTIGAMKTRTVIALWNLTNHSKQDM